MEKKNECNKVLCASYTIVYYSIIIFFVFIAIVACSCSIKLFYPKLELGSCAEFVTAVIALLASIVTYNEYISVKDTKQAQVLSEYNKRYSEDPNIVAVVQYLNYIDTDGMANNPVRRKPSNYEVEMFMRFFEELCLQIRRGRLNDTDVYNLFVYYANKLGKNKELRTSLGISDIEYEKHWDDFKQITTKYSNYITAK